jgi:putative transposase
VSRSGYYRWLKQANEPNKDHRDYLLIKEIFDKGKAKYGWRTIKMRLEREKRVIMNHKKISRIMRKYALIVKIRRKNPYKTIMRITAAHRTFANRLDRNFNQMVPQRFFCTDITYLPFNRRFAYLSVVKGYH